ncbi:metal ABC transporter permease [Salinisphaera sp. Q1T1-3]|uniref:metal ABC transporter permease n=1 Tax=Salinisphaera sp. Q1T1-3 TaxID=2321229 RepID=UPI000E74875E|nr:metal ABC transporter permease [Salinisphaera sp. Q1T1-3]RJS95235.1 metal ABC transporter permease [Salinisphaera sp. Q1T1-3]
MSLATAFTVLPAFAADTASQTQHLRGVITASTKQSVKLKTDNGQVRTVALTADTGVATAVPGDLDHIEQGTFIGTANVERGGQHQALEMVIFPPSMKGTGLGDYGWDLSPAEAGQGNGSMTAGSSMTNGTVQSKSSGSMTAGSSMTNGTVESKSGGAMSAGSSMTNGTVKHTNSGGDTITLKVDYGQGTKTIVVPRDVPTVKVAPGAVPDLKTGAHAFAIVTSNADGRLTAKKVIVGKNGTVPPM